VKKIDPSQHCVHCKEPIIVPSSLLVDDKEVLFCCNGCKTVFEILHAQGLANYYQLKKNSGAEKSTPVKVSSEKYVYLDSEEFLEKYSSSTESTITLRFYLEGVHCVACLWLIEKISDIIPQIITSQLNMSKSVVTVTGVKEIKFSKVAKLLEQLGYRPHPIMESEDVEHLNKLEDRRMMIKIAIAFACAGNTMLLSSSIYTGAEGIFKDYFRITSFAVSLPVVLYSAIPFYKTAFSAIRNKKVSIDIPIVFAIFLVMISGVINLNSGSEHIYFDSITVLIFLLLFARFILKKAAQKGLSASEISNFFSNQVANRLNEYDEVESIHAKFLNKLDKVLVEASENIPADGIILKGNSTVNNSLLSGESLPVKVNKGDYVYSGTVNIDSSLVIQVMNNIKDSRLGKILKNIEAGWNQKADIVTFADVVAKYFIITVLSLAMITLFSFGLSGSWETGLVRSLTLIIITCPCALGLTTPLALTLTLSKLAKNGIIIKNEKVIEKLTKAKQVFLDKTGTLTYGTFQIIDWKTIQEIKDLDNIVYSLESRSEHPIAKSISDYIVQKKRSASEQVEVIKFDSFNEIPGIGVEGYVDGNHFQIKSTSSTSTEAVTDVGVYLNSKLIHKIQLKDQLRIGAKEAIDKIKSLKMEPFILSGDNENTVSEISKSLNIAPENSFSCVSPEEKNEFINKYPEGIMIGDGANDAIALSNAYVGIAVHGSVDISLRAADIYISKSGVDHLTELFEAVFAAMRIIKRNLKFSLFYNVLGATLAITGHITPLLAAVLMPLSSLTVLISTFISSRKID
jgi:Cu2+-exporting ATPase/Cu+-exporting ATPase